MSQWRTDLTAPSFIGMLLHRRTTVDELYEASASLAIPLLRPLAGFPLNQRIAPLQACAAAKFAQPMLVDQLIPIEMLFHKKVLEIFGNQTLMYMSSLLHERLVGSLRDAPPIAAGRDGTAPRPALREIVHLVRSGCGSEAVQSAHERTARIGALLSGRDPLLTVVSPIKRADFRL